MRWQFGGNLQPVRMICELDWKECPSAIMNYVWSEIVTDVVDCLTNEWMIWRMIAMLFVCTLLIHTIYSKTRWMDETTINRENLNVVGCKVQDLELKVNILTYKMQYGTWPLPRQIRGTGIEGGLRNVRLTLTNSNDRNAWLKHMLLSPSENASCVPYAKIGPRSVRCLTKLINLETKYMASRFSRDPSPASNRIKSSKSTSEKSIKYERTSKKSLDIDRTKKILKSENLGMRSKEFVDFQRNPTNNCWSETQVLKYREYPKAYVRNYHENNTMQISSKKSSRFDKSPEERVNSTQETLHQVKEKLENLHSVLRIYGNPASTEIEERCSSKELAESILQDLKNIGNLPTESESDEKTCEIIQPQQQLLDSNTEESQCTNEEDEEEQRIDSTSEFEQCRSDHDSSSARSYENVLKNRYNEENARSNLDNFPNDKKSTEISGKKKSEVATKFGQDIKDLKDISLEPSVSKFPGTSKPNVANSSNVETEKFVPMEIDEDFALPSPNSSQAELSKDSDVDDKSNVTLLREALEFKKALITQIELENEEKQTEDRPEAKSDESESDEAIWPKVKSYFQPKFLDIISEEQSASSSNEKTTKTLRTSDKCVENEKFTINECTRELETLEATNENPESSKLDLASGSSEYFSLSNLEEKVMAQAGVGTVSRRVDTSTDCTECEMREFDEMYTKQEEENVQKSISDLVNQSVKNIREYIEVFSQLQNDAIIETRRAIDDENDNEDTFDRPKESSSVDSITHFVNSVAITISEELPRKLSEPAILHLVDLEAINSDEESLDNSDYKPDFSLKRRPGSTSIAEKKSANDEKEFSNDNVESRSLFESARSETENDDDDRCSAGYTEIVSSEPSCKELVMDYLLDSESDFPHEKLAATMNLMEFEEEIDRRDDCDERFRPLDSPLTGRTVIRATGSSTSNLELASMNGSNEPVESMEYETRNWHHENSRGEEIFERELVDIGELMDIEALTEIPEINIVPGTSSVYFTDEASVPNILPNSQTIKDDKLANVENNTWIIENSDQAKAMIENTLTEKPKVTPEELIFAIQSRNSAISETPTDSKDFMEHESHGDSSKRPKSADTIAITNSAEAKLEKDRIPGKINLSIDTSGTYMDATSRDFINSSTMNLKLDKAILNAPTNFARDSSSKSARGSCSSPLQQRIPWNAPKRGTSLNNASSGKTKKNEKNSVNDAKTKESSRIAVSVSQQSKFTRSQSSSGDQSRVRSNYSLSGTRDLESSNTTMGRQTNKSNVDRSERRSRSYATPRKSETSPRNSTILQSADIQRPSRARKERAISKTSVESEISDKSTSALIGRTSSRSVGKNSSKSCIPILRRRLEAVRQSSLENRAKSPMRCPLTISTSSWSQDTRLLSDSLPIANIQAEGSPDMETRNVKDSINLETLHKIDPMKEESIDKLPESRTVIYVNIVTEQEHKSATRVVDPKKFLEYLKDRELKIQSVLHQEIGVEGFVENCPETVTRSSPRILTIVSSAVDGEIRSEQSLLPHCSDNSATTARSWSLRVEHREIEVSAKPSVIDTSTSISDLPDVKTETRPDRDEKFQIFEVPKELTKDEYIVLLEALNQDPNLHQLREMHKLCNKLGLGFHE